MFLRTVFTVTSVLATASATSITGCHNHGTDYFCIDTAGVEGQISPAPTGSSVPSSYTSCHNHGTETWCMNGDDEVLFAAEVASVSATITSSASSSGSASSVAAQTTAVTGCHTHGSNLFCIDGSGNEGQITPAPSGTAVPESYTGCHTHSTATFCLDSAGEEVQFLVEETTESGDADDEEMDCHYHAGVPHCVPKSGSSSSRESTTCERNNAEYNIPLRIGLIFAILATDFIGVYGPLLVKRWFSVRMDGLPVTLLKQFGTGVILSTALVHLLTHASLMFGNSCLELKYESTATSIAMAGLFLAFVVEFLMTRLLNNRVAKLKAANGAGRSSEEEGQSLEDEKIQSEEKVTHDHEGHAHHELDVAAKQDKIAVSLLEAGIVFHSVLIGITLVVTPDLDGAFITLFIVIIFHQMFEGVALGTRIAELTTVGIWTKLLMGALFAVTTPVGMAIGTGVLNQFNGNDPSTIVALGTLDALSAGILLWVGLIEMLSHDWLHGPLATAGWINVAIGFLGLIGGMVLMSFIGKWA